MDASAASEEASVAAIPFIDTHVHFYDLQHPSLEYGWLQAGVKHHILEAVEPIQAQRYWADDWLAESRFANVVKSIHVECAVGTPDPVEETRWLQAFADRLGQPHGIVAEVHLARPDAEEVLDRHLEFPNLRGVRDFGEGDYELDPAWRRGFAHLARHDLVACLDSGPERYAKVKALADAFPHTRISLDHAGLPLRRDEEYLALWRREIASLAEAPNVIVKVSALGMGDPRWTVDSMRPLVLHCIESFGVERTVFGTNWPVDRLFSSYPDVIDAYATIISDFSASEQTAMFSGNAERYFRI
jgi:predicted TIM-barrel fold metal-dependent hydrolase